MLGNGGRFTVILQVGHEVNHIIITCRSCFRLELVFVRDIYIYIYTHFCNVLQKNGNQNPQILYNFLD